MDDTTKEERKRSAIETAILLHLKQKDKRSEPVAEERRKQVFRRRAIDIARIAYAHKKDKRGEDVIDHSIAVASMCKSETDRCAALLHDLVEDTEISLEFLRECFDDIKEYGPIDDIIEAVKYLTWEPGVTPEEYLTQIARADKPIAFKVKMVDMRHNSSDERNPISVFGQKVVADRKKKYRGRQDFLEKERAKYLKEKMKKEKGAERLLRNIEMKIKKQSLKNTQTTTKD